MDKKNKIYFFLILLTIPLFFMSSPVIVSAGSTELSDEKIVTILYKCRSVFEQNSLFACFLRFLGWGVMKLLASVASSAEKLYDICFGFVDFTTYSSVNNYIDKFEKVWGALVCLSLLGLGLILIFWQEKKPKFVVNVMLAVLIITSSTFLIQKMNGFLSSGVRSELIGGSSSATATYELIGSNIHDLLYLDSKVGIENFNKKNEDGIKNYKLTYETFNKQMFEMVDINETLDPDNYSDEMKSILSNYLYIAPAGTAEEIHENAEKIAGRRLPVLDSSVTSEGDNYFFLGEVYDGVAWTDLLNEFYYRYTVDWWAAYLELLSLLIVYIFMSYKVIRGIWEITEGRFFAMLYSANLAGGKKILKILECIKDAYVVLILTTVFIKFYLMACKFVGTMDVSGIGKGLILLFLAFAVIDGPNLVQKLTGIDAGMSDGMGKMMTMFYGTQMAASVAGLGKNLAFGRDGHGGVFGTLSHAFSGMNDAGGGSADPGNVPPGGMRENDPENGDQSPDQDEKASGQDPVADQNGQMPQNENFERSFSGSMDEDLNQNDTLNQSEDFNQNIDSSEGDGDGQDIADTTSEGEPPDLSDPSVRGELADDLAAQSQSRVPGEGTEKNANANSRMAEALNGMDPVSLGNGSGISSSMNRMDQDLGGGNAGESLYGTNNDSFGNSEIRQAGGQIFTPQQHEERKKDVSKNLLRQSNFKDNDEN